MEKIIDGHLVGFDTLRDLEGYEHYIWHGGAMSVIRYNAYQDTPSKQDCDKLCAELSGDVIVYKKGK
ncbi:hypothetical protein F3157_08195 [Virgibacillus dakarensis]|nr:hypothetical protein [Virgibacillus dakarensis]